MDTKEQILSRDWSSDFVAQMQNRIIVSHHKYGWCSDTYPELAQAVKSIKTRVDKYLETGNTEWLIDVANFAMIEYKHPSHPNAHFRGTDSNESPGLTDGISAKELMESMN
jgi:hypothetical protein